MSLKAELCTGQHRLFWNTEWQHLLWRKSTPVSRPQLRWINTTLWKRKSQRHERELQDWSWEANQWWAYCQWHRRALHGQIVFAILRVKRMGRNPDGSSRARCNIALNLCCKCRSVTPPDRSWPKWTVNFCLCGSLCETWCVQTPPGAAVFHDILKGPIHSFHGQVYGYENWGDSSASRSRSIRWLAGFSPT